METDGGGPEEQQLPPAEAMDTHEADPPSALGVGDTITADIVAGDHPTAGLTPVDAAAVPSATDAAAAAVTTTTNTATIHTTPATGLIVGAVAAAVDDIVGDDTDQPMLAQSDDEAPVAPHVNTDGGGILSPPSTPQQKPPSPPPQHLHHQQQQQQHQQMQLDPLGATPPPPPLSADIALQQHRQEPPPLLLQSDGVDTTTPSTEPQPPPNVVALNMLNSTGGATLTSNNATVTSTVNTQQQLQQQQQHLMQQQQQQPPLPPQTIHTMVPQSPPSAQQQQQYQPSNRAADLADGGCADAAMPDEEETRSEATFRYRVENFSLLRDSVLSPPCYVRNLPWKIMVMPRNNPPAAGNAANDRPPVAGAGAAAPAVVDNRSLGFFLQCNGESESTSWSCNAIAELRLTSFRADTEPFLRKIKHLFYSKENDWGFSHFMSWPEILDPERGYVMDDAIELEVHVVAEAPHGVFWDSKKHTGYVGLKNQGATCYMNSLLQTLYFTNRLRQAVYKMPTEADDSSKSVALALQRVFHDLQFLDKPVGTKKLTKSFGWETMDSFMQHDVQEFLRVLLDKLESKMKRTCVEGTVPRLFEGKMASYIKCKNVDYTSTRQETFYDIQLNIKGKKNIAESFRDYVATETLEGDNKYDAGEHGLQEAEKGVIFVGFPPVLHLHLMRFQYDPITDSSVKFNDRFEFYEHINLDEYLQQPRGGNDAAAATTTAEAAAADSTDGGSGAAAGAAANEQRPAAPTTPPPEPADRADYTLHAVLVHSGDNHGGHYVVYINPTGDGRWCKFDDDVVSRCTKDEAILHNYGGVDDDITLHAKHCSNAYMLVYIRDSAMPQILQEIGETEIPTELTDRLHEERRMEQVRRRERAEANTYMTVNVLLEEYLDGHHTTDLFDAERVHFRVFKLKKTQTVGELIEQVADVLRTRKERLRLWPLIQRHNQITRLAAFEWRDEWQKALINCADMQNPWTVFVEQLPASSRLLELPPFDRETQLLVFFKYYDPTAKRLNYVGLGYFGLQQRVAELAVEMCARVGWPVGQPVTVYEEQGANSVQRLTNLGETVERVLRYSPQSIRDIDGTVLIFERTQPQHQQPPHVATAASVAAAAAATGPASAVSHGEAAASAAIGTAATPSAATTAAATATAATVVAGANVAAISAAAAAQAAAATAAAASAAAAVAAALSGGDTDADMPTVNSTTAGDGVVHSNSALGGGTTNLSNSALSGGDIGLNAAQSAAVAIGQTAAATAGIAVGRGELPQSTATGRSNPATITGPATPTGAAEPPSTQQQQQQQPLVSASALSTAVSNVVGSAPNTQLATAAASAPPAAAAGHNLELPTCEDYFRDLLYRVEVTFIDKTVPTDGGFSLELSQRMTYDQMASAVGQKINCEPNKIQFFKCQNYKDIPGHPLRCNYEGNLKELLVYTKPKGAKKIFYQQLSMNIDELESKKQFKCLWLSINMKEEKELILFPNKNGTVKTLLEEAAKQIEFNFEEGSGQLRIVEVTNCKLLNGPQEDDLLEFLQASGETSITNPKIYRIEEVPRDEANLKDDEMLVPVSHFFKDVYNMFGVPFLVKTRQGEPFGALKERVRKKCAVPDKEWEKYKFALVSGGRIEYINDDDMPVSLADFRPAGNPPPVRTYLGLEHMNKTQKRSRFNYLEKAIKIYN